MQYDVDRPSFTIPGTPAHAHVCNLCTASFNSSRALSMHIRAKHHQRTPLRLYCDGSGTCPVCKVTFDSRLRVIAHLSEKRCRGKSKVTCQAHLSRYPMISQELCDRLDDIDRTQRYHANKQGRAKPRVALPAKRSRKRGLPDDFAPAPFELVLPAPAPRRRLRQKTSVSLDPSVAP